MRISSLLNQHLYCALLLLVVLIDAKEFRIGIKGGLSFSNTINLETAEEFQPNTGVIAGIAVGIGEPQLFELQPELLYYQRGHTGSIGSEWEYIKNYLEVPLLCKWNFTPVETPVRGTAYIGPSLGFLLSAYQIHDNGNKISITDTYNRVDLGVAFGGGIGIRLGNGRVILDARETIGIINANGSSDADYAINTSFSLMLGYMLEFGRIP